ncbi:N-acetyltransferase [Streptomyces sp. VRA16 Mangrove soil]|uniref:GNAT family N-acetyltransferase n=1 Tax=Streptomyces sp. VRA16 Mangrove soil TaxID=2817434 RepID=UPI001A9E3583|nr:GNAT family N-acetyltransferase [Streptomyces sp. VRA16 Mangrove soil]MBO1337916.1 GNAT family N-acetyltransferase [Streptomyces sp. VRA16 Mangrove soil]
MLLETVAPGRPLPTDLITEVTALYSANREFFALSGDFPDPDRITAEQVSAALTEDVESPGAELLLARDADGRLLGLALTLAHHPDPADPDPWIGLLMVDARRHRSGHGREFARAVEERLRRGGRTAVRLAVLENNPKGLAFWTALGYEEIARRRDLQLDRPCRVLRKPLANTAVDADAPSPVKSPNRPTAVD